MHEWEIHERSVLQGHLVVLDVPLVVSVVLFIPSLELDQREEVDLLFPFCDLQERGSVRTDSED